MFADSERLRLQHLDDSSSSGVCQGGGGQHEALSTSNLFGANSSPDEIVNNIADIVTKRILSTPSQSVPKFAAINPNWKNYERAQPTVITDGTVNTTPPNQFNAPIFENDLNDIFDEHHLLTRIPKTVRKKASELLKVFDQQPNEITWDSTGNIYVEGNVIPSANIFKIFPLLFKKTVNKPPPGMPDFVHKLREMGLSNLIACKNIALPSHISPKPSTSSQNWWYLGD